MRSPTRIARLKGVLEQAARGKASILDEPTLASAHSYCASHRMSAQCYGPLIEGYIIAKNGFTKTPAAAAAGDCARGGARFELKVSLGGARGRFNFVQVRPAHVDWFVLTAYHLAPDTVDRGGDLYVFKVPAREIPDLVTRFGGYAHGTVAEFGKITRAAFDKTREYALRPAFGDNCWTELCQYAVREDAI